MNPLKHKSMKYLIINEYCVCVHVPRPGNKRSLVRQTFDRAVLFAGDFQITTERLTSLQNEKVNLTLKLGLIGICCVRPFEFFFSFHRRLSYVSEITADLKFMILKRFLRIIILCSVKL